MVKEGMAVYFRRMRATAGALLRPGDGVSLGEALGGKANAGDDKIRK
jgi:hypothetical protein